MEVIEYFETLGAGVISNDALPMGTIVEAWALGFSIALSCLVFGAIVRAIFRAPKALGGA